MENGHVTEIASLMEGEWSCYGGDQFKEGRIVSLKKGEWLRENGHGHFNRGRITEGRMVMLQRWCLMEGRWSL